MGLKDQKKVKPLEWLINKAPFIMLVISGLTGLLYYFGFYHYIYNFLSDSIGYSLLTNLVMYKFYSHKAFCNTTRIAVLGLIFMNLTSIFCYFVDTPNALYDTYIFILTLFLIRYYQNDTKE